MKKLTLLIALGLLCGCATAPATRSIPTVATFSIVAFDPETGDLGVAVQSKVLGCGAIVPYAKADVGAVATQAYANPTFGPDGLDLLNSGKTPQEAVDILVTLDKERGKRQLGIVDARGRSGAYTGKDCMDYAGHKTAANYSCQGNILTGDEVVSEMGRAFEETKGPLPDRLIAALEAGQAAGGDKRGRQSAALLVVRKDGGYAGGNDRWIDLRVDDHTTPIRELRRLYQLHRKTFGTPKVPERPELPNDEPAQKPEKPEKPEGPRKY